MIGIAFSVIGAAVDITAIMLLRYILRHFIGDGVTYLSLSQSFLMLLYLTFAFPLRLSVCREALRCKRRGGSEGSVLRPGFLIAIPSGLISGLLLAVLAGFLSEKVFSFPHLYLSLLLIAPGIIFVILSSPFSGAIDSVSAAGNMFMRSAVRLALIIVPSFFGAMAGRRYGSKIALILMNPKEPDVLGSAGAALGLSVGMLVAMVLSMVFAPIWLRKAEKKAAVSMELANLSPTPAIISDFVPGALTGLLFMASVLCALSRGTGSEEVDVVSFYRVLGATEPLIVIFMVISCAMASLFLIRPFETLDSDERKKYGSRFSRALRYSIAFSSLFAALCASLNAPLHNLITGRNDVPVFISALSALAIIGAPVLLSLYLAAFEESSYFFGAVAVAVSSVVSLFAALAMMLRNSPSSVYGALLVLLLTTVLASSALVFLKMSSKRGRIRSGDVVAPVFVGIILSIVGILLRMLVEYIAGSLTALLVCFVLVYLLWVILMCVFRILSPGLMEKLPAGRLGFVFSGDIDGGR